MLCAGVCASVLVFLGPFRSAVFPFPYSRRCSQGPWLAAREKQPAKECLCGFPTCAHEKESRTQTGLAVGREPSMQPARSGRQVQSILKAVSLPSLVMVQIGNLHQEAIQFHGTKHDSLLSSL